MNTFTDWANELDRLTAAAVVALEALAGLPSPPTPATAEETAAVLAWRRDRLDREGPITDTDELASDAAELVVGPRSAVGTAQRALREDLLAIEQALPTAPGIVMTASFDDRVAIAPTVPADPYRRVVVAAVDYLPAGHPCKDLLPREQLVLMSNGRGVVLGPAVRWPSGVFRPRQWYSLVGIIEATKERHRKVAEAEAEEQARRADYQRQREQEEEARKSDPKGARIRQLEHQLRALGSWIG
jgi:hypothetical protein